MRPKAFRQKARFRGARSNQNESGKGKRTPQPPRRTLWGGSLARPEGVEDNGVAGRPPTNCGSGGCAASGLDGIAAEVCPILAKGAAELANPACTESVLAGHVPGPLAHGQIGDQMAVAVGAAARRSVIMGDE